MSDEILHTPQDLTQIRLEQARILKSGARSSCFIVSCVLAYITVAIFFSHSVGHALIWAVSGYTMVGITYAYATFMAPKGITEHNLNSYLTGHIIVTCLTGLVWSAFAIYHSDFSSSLTLFISGTIVCTITIGGMLPGSAYRPAFLGLAICTILPLAFYWVVYAPAPIRLFGVGLFLYFALGLFASAKAELNTRDGIIARTTKILSEKLMEKNLVIQQAHDEKTRFLAATSHDLSQPLHAQGYFIEALRRNLNTPAQHDLLDKIEASWQSQGKLLQGLVDVTRLDSGAIIPSLRRVNLKEELQVLQSEFENTASEKGVTFTATLSEIWVQSDPILLSRILRNLISNAVKFTPSGGTVTLSVTPQNEHAHITVSDTGPGIAREHHDKIFDEYVQLDNPQKNRDAGLGLGLSIVRRLSELLELELIFNSVPEAGTHFEIVLPLTTHTTQAAPKPPPRHTPFANMPFIVLVDDEAAIREAMSLLMTDWGCLLITAASGDEAIALLSETSSTPDVFIVDKRLAHNESGLALIGKLREEVNANIPAIIMTGDIQGFEDLQSEESITLLTKPVNPDAIKALLQNILNPERG